MLIRSSNVTFVWVETKALQSHCRERTSKKHECSGPHDQCAGGAGAGTRKPPALPDEATVQHLRERYALHSRGYFQDHVTNCARVLTHDTTSRSPLSYPWHFKERGMRRESNSHACAYAHLRHRELGYSGDTARENSAPAVSVAHMGRTQHDLPCIWSLLFQTCACPLPPSTPYQRSLRS